MNIDDASKNIQRDLRVEVRKALTKQPMSERELADALNVAPKTIRQVLGDLRASGLNISTVAHDRLLLYNIVEPGGRVVLKPKPDSDGWITFGVTTDNHLGNRHSRLDVLNEAYDDFDRSGITDVLNAGNWIDGEARFNKSELLVFGMDAQLDYMAQEFPQRKGITTYLVSGDDHEGWYAQRECINIGQYMQMRAERAGRTDLRYIGHVEADIELRSGKGSVALRLMHPGGGSAYAYSYAPQKLVESFQGGEKPPVVIIGHYHKFDYCFPREVHVVSAGCTEDQTMFMRKNKIGAHVGWLKVRVKQDQTLGHITDLAVQWTPRYDRGFYERRFS